MMSISSPFCCATAAKGSNKAANTASQRGIFFMERSIGGNRNEG